MLLLFEACLYLNVTYDFCYTASYNEVIICTCVELVRLEELLPCRHRKKLEIK